MIQEEVIKQLKMFSIAKTISETYDFIPDKDEYPVDVVLDELGTQGIETDKETVTIILDKYTGYGYDYIATEVYTLIDQL